MTTIVRFAPSPTGLLHVGNLRPAILNWLFARKHDGTFILRLDDTDQTRSKDAFADRIREDLRWLGLVWAREFRQSDRTARYAEVAEALKASGRLYPCYETEDELDRRRKRQLARGMPPIYDRAALKVTPEEKAAQDASGRSPHWRFHLANTGKGSGFDPLPTHVMWRDLIRGDQIVDVGSLSDPVLIRADGTMLYTFTSVVDDIDCGITHIIRGEDHVTNTGVQIQLFEALQARLPLFAHHSLLVGRDGGALSKRLGALSLAAFREMGFEPMTVVSHAALVGTSEAIATSPSLDDLAAKLDLDKISLAPARFDVEDLGHLNARFLHGLSFAKVEHRLKGMGIGGGEGFWLAVRGNLHVLADATTWWFVVSGDITPMIEDAGLAARALELLPPEPWDTGTWGAWTKAVGAATGTKGRDLYHPLRLALTAQQTGPELKVLLPLIGRDRVVARLRGAAFP